MKKVISYLKSAKARPGYKLFVEFEDGISGVIELLKWKEKPAFSFWNEENNFIFFKITAEKKIEWNDQVDINPDAFYLQLVNKTFDEYAGDKQFLQYSH